MLKTVLAALGAAIALSAGPAAAQGASPTLARIKAAKAINVAYSPDSAPFSSVSGNAAPQGYSIELCKRAIAQIARAVGEPELKVNWMAGSVTERVQMVASGRAELECANTTQTQTRLASVDFSNLIFIDGGGLLVKAGAPINRIADLAGKRVAVLKGTTTQTRLTETLRARNIDATLMPIDDAGVGLSLLEAGTVDAYAGDKVKLTALALTLARRIAPGAGGRGPVLRTLCAGAAAQRFGLPARSQQGADAGLHGRRHRTDLRAVAGQAGPADRPAGADVPAELDP